MEDTEQYTDYDISDEDPTSIPEETEAIQKLGDYCITWKKVLIKTIILYHLYNLYRHIKFVFTLANLSNLFASTSMSRKISLESDPPPPLPTPQYTNQTKNMHVNLISRTDDSWPKGKKD